MPKKKTAKLPGLDLDPETDFRGSKIAGVWRRLRDGLCDTIRARLQYPLDGGPGHAVDRELGVTESMA